jgi:hypothetical protein
MRCLGPAARTRAHPTTIPSSQRQMQVLGAHRAQIMHTVGLPREAAYASPEFEWDLLRPGLRCLRADRHRPDFRPTILRPARPRRVHQRRPGPGCDLATLKFTFAGTRGSVGLERQLRVSGSSHGSPSAIVVDYVLGVDTSARQPLGTRTDFQARRTWPRESLASAWPC